MVKTTELNSQTDVKMRSTKREKGRSIVQPAQTLHHFFKTAPHRQKLDKSTFTNNNSSSRISISREIIVIDSDDDDEVEILESTKPVKRRRLSADACLNRNLGETWSDISSIKSPDSEENTLPGVFKNTLSTMIENKPVLSFGTYPKPSCKDFVQGYSFGQPSALLQGDPARKRDAVHSEHPPFVNYVSEEKLSFSQTNDVDVDLTLEDWENDHNERPFQLKTGDDWMIPGNADDVSRVAV